MTAALCGCGPATAELCWNNQSSLCKSQAMQSRTLPALACLFGSQDTKKNF